VEGYLTIRSPTGIIADQINIKDYFNPLDAGRIYKITITVNQNSFQVGNISVNNWLGGLESSITINS
jgi:hypothetical protein